MWKNESNQFGSGWVFRGQLVDQKLQEYCNKIVQCLVRYGGLEEVEAQRLVHESEICEPKTEMARNMLFHELAYYWAMELLYASDNPYWWKDPALWPPPKECYDLKGRETDL